MLLSQSRDCQISLVSRQQQPLHSSLTAAVEISKKELDDLGIFASILGHIGDGNFHSSIMYDPKNPEQKARVEKVVYDMVDRALDMEGSCTVSLRVLAVQAGLTRGLGGTWCWLRKKVVSQERARACHNQGYA